MTPDWGSFTGQLLCTWSLWKSPLVDTFRRQPAPLTPVRSDWIKGRRVESPSSIHRRRGVYRVIGQSIEKTVVFKRKRH